jgi:hypothetical protein
MKVFLLLLSIGSFSAPALSAVGFEQLSVPDPPRKALSVTVWFPSVGRSVSSSVGPFQQMVVPDGRVLGTGDYRWFRFLMVQEALTVATTIPPLLFPVKVSL